MFRAAVVEWQPPLSSSEIFQQDDFMSRRSVLLMLLVVFVLTTTAPASAQSKEGKPLTGYKAITVEKATVEKNAATEEFPGGYDAVMQKSIIANLQKKKVFEKVIDGAESNSTEEKTQRLILSTTVIAFDKGNRAARYLVGFGAGATKVKVRFTLRDAETGRELLTTDKQGKFFGVISFVGGDKDHAVAEAAGDVVDGLIKEINKKR